MTGGMEATRSLMIIVEPNETVREMMQRLITGMGWHVLGLHPNQLTEWVTSNQEQQVSAQLIDIGISPDLVPISLLHLTQLWKGKMPPTCFIGTNPIIIDDLKRQGYRALLKPFSASTLRAVLASCCEEKGTSIQINRCLPQVHIPLLQGVSQ